MPLSQTNAQSEQVFYLKYKKQKKKLTIMLSWRIFFNIAKFYSMDDK